MAEEQVTQEAPETVSERYDLHIRISDVSRPKLMKSAQLAHKMGLITNPTLTELMNLYANGGRELL